MWCRWTGSWWCVERWVNTDRLGSKVPMCSITIVQTHCICTFDSRFHTLCVLYLCITGSGFHPIDTLEISVFYVSAAIKSTTLHFRLWSLIILYNIISKIIIMTGVLELLKTESGTLLISFKVNTHSFIGFKIYIKTS